MSQIKSEIQIKSALIALQQLKEDSKGRSDYSVEYIAAAHGVEILQWVLGENERFGRLLDDLVKIDTIFDDISASLGEKLAAAVGLVTEVKSSGRYGQ